MNSEAQRARNKRKRDKLRAKRRTTCSGSPILRFRLDGEVAVYHNLCGLLNPDLPKNYWLKWCPNWGRIERDVYQDITYSHWSTEWVYMSTHDLSVSARDAIQAFFNTKRQFHEQQGPVVKLLIQCNGVTRRHVWRGHTPGARHVGRVVCSFRSSLFKEESSQTPCIASLPKQQ